MDWNPAAPARSTSSRRSHLQACLKVNHEHFNGQAWAALALASAPANFTMFGGRQMQTVTLRTPPLQSSLKVGWVSAWQWPKNMYRQQRCASKGSTLRGPASLQTLILHKICSSTNYILPNNRWKEKVGRMCEADWTQITPTTGKSFSTWGSNTNFTPWNATQIVTLYFILKYTLL